MTQQDNKVLACVDLSPYAEYVADCAAWAAERMGAPLEFMHVIDRHPALPHGQDHSGALVANAQETLLRNMSEEDAARTRAERDAARRFLQGLRERALTAGADPVDTRQRHGDLAETLSEQQERVRLFVLGRRGASASTSPRPLGSQVEWTVRSLQRPILTVTERFKTPERVLIAFDGSAITRRGVEMVAQSPLFKGLSVHVLMSGKPSGDAGKQIGWARQTLEQAGLGEVVTDIEPGAPETVIGQTVTRLDIDLLIMGAYTHSPWRQLLAGSKTTDVLRAVKVPTLLLR